MRKPLLLLLVIMLFCGAIGLLAYRYLEIYPRTKTIPPSKEAQRNPYWALDKWLLLTGKDLRVQDWGTVWSLTSRDAATVFIQASLFDWDTDDMPSLLSWIESGGSLIVSIDEYDAEDLPDGLTELLEPLEIRLEQHKTPVKAGTNIAFDGTVSFAQIAVRSGTLIEHYTDEAGIIRLLRRSVGRGTITVTGVPYFLHNEELGDSNENSNLAWHLFGSEQGSIFFIRGEKQELSLLGTLFHRGDFTCLLLSLCLVIGVGLWLVLPQFGRIEQDKERVLKSIRERFLAEAYFLKQYKGLDTYRQAYIEEIKHRVTRIKARDKSGDEPLVQSIYTHCGKNKLLSFESIAAALAEGAPRSKYTMQTFVKDLAVLKTILECL
ncbi:hypothetical protein FACS1894200_01070 [Spirochaetia bacterium]|nr:hypothetical protein FACS1894200_01070 [Spirochaetia bacterium]